MKISALASMWICAVFAVACTGVVASGFIGLQEVTDPAEREASLGYIAFWSFLGGIGILFGVLSWMLKEGKFGKFED